MIDLPEVLTETPERDSVDVLGDILASMRLSGGVVIDAETKGPSCILSQFDEDDCARFFPVPAHVIAYHYVRSGTIWVELPGEPPVQAGPGCIIVLPRNDEHLLYSEPGLPPVSSHDLLEPAANGEPTRLRLNGGEGEAVSLYCGFLGSMSPENALLQSLPGIMLIHAREEAASDWLESSLRFAAEEQRNAPPAMVARLTELLFGEAVRRYVEELPKGSGGWLAGLHDPPVAKALSIIHNRYAEALDVNGLAREVGMSRSAFADRFTGLIGESPMRYCARWRMRMAANLLRDHRQNSGNVAYEVGFNSEAAFTRAFKREYGMPPAAWRRRVAAEPHEPPVEPRRPVQNIRYATASDGTRLAWSAVGEGVPLVKAANWLNHIEHDWDSPLWRHWMDELTRERTLIRYDERGTGLSDWETPNLTFEDFVEDLATVVEAAGRQRFDLLGLSQGAAVSIAYSVRHPERVRRMVLVGGYALGWAKRDLPDEAARREAMITLTRTGWGAGNPAFRQMFTTLYIPEASPEQMDWFNDVQRRSASPAMAERMQRVLSGIDVTGLLERVTVPTLVMHVRNDSVVPFATGRSMAERIPGARFVALEGANHILLRDEPAWAVFVDELNRFLA